MRWTIKNRSIARKNRLEKWHEWWAWYPVKVGYNDEDGSNTWELFTKVWRKGWSGVKTTRRFLFIRYRNWEWKYKDNATMVKERLLRENLENNEPEGDSYGTGTLGATIGPRPKRATGGNALNNAVANIQTDLADDTFQTMFNREARRRIRIRRD